MHSIFRKMLEFVRRCPSYDLELSNSFSGTNLFQIDFHRTDTLYVKPLVIEN